MPKFVFTKRKVLLIKVVILLAVIAILVFNPFSGFKAFRFTGASNPSAHYKTFLIQGETVLILVNVKIGEFASASPHIIINNPDGNYELHLLDAGLNSMWFKPDKTGFYTFDLNAIVGGFGPWGPVSFNLFLVFDPFLFLIISVPVLSIVLYFLFFRHRVPKKETER